jgi:hypothetical protein
MPAIALKQCAYPGCQQLLRASGICPLHGRADQWDRVPLGMEPPGLMTHVGAKWQTKPREIRGFGCRIGAQIAKAEYAGERTPVSGVDPHSELCR